MKSRIIVSDDLINGVGEWGEGIRAASPRLGVLPAQELGLSC